MAWEESDDTIADEYIQKLTVEEQRLNVLLRNVQTLKNGAYKIKSVSIATFNEQEKIVESVSPNDLSGEPMKDDYRLEQLKQIIANTEQLLGNENE